MVNGSKSVEFRNLENTLNSEVDRQTDRRKVLKYSTV